MTASLSGLLSLVDGSRKASGVSTSFCDTVQVRRTDEVGRWLFKVGASASNVGGLRAPPAVAATVCADIKTCLTDLERREQVVVHRHHGRRHRSSSRASA